MPKYMVDAIIWGHGTRRASISITAPDAQTAKEKFWDDVLQDDWTDEVEHDDHELDATEITP